MPKEAAEWRAHLASGYDGAMTVRCDHLLAVALKNFGRAPEDEEHEELAFLLA